MVQLFNSIAITIIAINQIIIARRVYHHQKAISAIMDMLIKKWTMEMQMGQSLMDKYVDESLDQLFRREEDK